MTVYYGILIMIIIDISIASILVHWHFTKSVTALNKDINQHLKA